MPEMRLDPIQKRWVIIATERSRRPSEYQVVVTQSPPEFCPLCPGNEDKTPEEILAIRDGYGAPNSPGWSVRVVANKYPALRIEGELDARADGIYDVMNGIGAHEIVVESPLHEQHTADQSSLQLGRVLRAYRDRMRDLMKDRRFAYVAVFRNYGESAGASLSHPHAQIIAMPIIPQVIQVELGAALEHHHVKVRCLFCDIVRHEAKLGTRVVAQSAEFVAITPYASRSPFEMMILPLEHGHDFTEISDAQLDGLAAILKETLGKLRTVLTNPPYNFVIHTSPSLASGIALPDSAERIRAAFHWHIELIPRLAKSAGFKWGTGFHINPTPPEDAAEFLRGAE